MLIQDGIAAICVCKENSTWLASADAISAYLHMWMANIVIAFWNHLAFCLIQFWKTFRSQNCNNLLLDKMFTSLSFCESSTEELQDLQPTATKEC